jgi:hypothetical protein
VRGAVGPPDGAVVGWPRRRGGARRGAGSAGELLLAAELLGGIAEFEEARVSAVAVGPVLDERRSLLLHMGVLAFIWEGQLQDPLEHFLDYVELELESVALHALVEKVHSDA